MSLRACIDARGALRRDTAMDPPLRNPPYSRGAKLRNWVMGIR